MSKMFKDKLTTRQANGKFAWSRRQNESFEQFALFTEFLESADRSIEDVAEKNNLQHSFVNNTSKDFNWHERAAAYDFHNLKEETGGLEPMIISSKETSLIDMTDKHMMLANKAQKVASICFSLLEDYVKDYQYAKERRAVPPSRPPVKPEDIVLMARFGVETERLSLGQASKIVENKTKYEKLSTEKLEQLQALLAEAEEGEENEE